jgi:hypothetical protein
MDALSSVTFNRAENSITVVWLLTQKMINFLFFIPLLKEIDAQSSWR